MALEIVRLGREACSTGRGWGWYEGIGLAGAREVGAWTGSGGEETVTSERGAASWWEAAGLAREMGLMCCGLDGLFMGERAAWGLTDWGRGGRGLDKGSRACGAATGLGSPCSRLNLFFFLAGPSSIGPPA